MGEYRADLRDIEFVLYEQLGVESLSNHPLFRDQGRDLYDAVISEAYRFAREVLSPINTTGDREGCRFEGGKVFLPESFHQAYRRYCEGGWIAATASPEYGGGGIPAVIGMVCGEFFVGACTAFTLIPGLTRGVARLIESFGTPMQKETFCRRLYTGEWSGTMVLTEPQAGSAVGDIRAVARREGDHYLLEGNKIFVTGGEQDLTENIIHLVLARTPGAAPGIKGLSLFIVPKYRFTPRGSLGDFNDVTCSGIEHKMGINASPTCTMNFGDGEDCHAWLLGEEGKGMKMMFHLMNEARIGVGLQALALGGAAYQEALAYAKERIQGVDMRNFKDPDAPRVPITVHPDVKRMLMTMKAYTEGGRALLLKTGFTADLARCAGDEGEREKYSGFLDLMTPVCKAFVSDTSFRVTELAIQVLGGYGYCREYPVEQYMRDVKISSIYEGTNGIQAMDLLGRKVGQKGGVVLMNYMMELNSFINAHKGDEELGAFVRGLEGAKNALAGVTVKFGQMNSSGDLLYPLLHATPYLHMFGEVACGHLLLEGAFIAREKLADIFEKGGGATREARMEIIKENPEANFYHNKVCTARFFASDILPHVLARAEAIKGGDRGVLEAEF